MKKSLVNRIIVSAVLGGALICGGGCTHFYKDPLSNAAIGTMPRFLQPGAYRDLKEKEVRGESRREEEARNRERYRNMKEEKARNKKYMEEKGLPTYKGAI